MLPDRIHTSKSAQNQLSLIKQKTGITPNIIARLAIAYSIEDRFEHANLELDTEGQEFNLSTLLGELVPYYHHLLVELHNTTESKELGSALSAHIEHGLSKFKSLRSLDDLILRII